MADISNAIAQKLNEVIFSPDPKVDARPLLKDLLIRSLDDIDRQVLQRIFDSKDLAGASQKMLVEQLGVSKGAISKSLKKLEQLDLIHATGRSKSGVFYDIDQFRIDTIIADRYLHEEPPITRHLRIDCITGYYQGEVPRIILKGYGSQTIVIRLKDMERLLEHLEYLIPERKKAELDRLKKQDEGNT